MKIRLAHTGVSFQWTALACAGSFALTCLSGCTASPTAPGPPSSPPPPPNNPEVTALQIAPKVASIARGGAIQFVLTAVDQNGEPLAIPPAAWSSSSPQVAQVSILGRAAGLAVGRATIQAQVGTVSTETTIDVVEVDGFIMVSAEGVATCGVTGTGRAYCWGGSAHRGDGSSNDDPSMPIPSAVSGGHTFAQVSSGTGSSTCGVTLEGIAYCWGSNINNELGASTNDPCPTAQGPFQCSFVPAQVETGLRFRWAGSGYKHSCAITLEHLAYCWGFNPAGQVGVSPGENVQTPVAVGTAITFASVSGGINHTCGLSTAGRVYCWGSNAFVLPASAARGPPTLISQDVFVAVSSGGYHACGVLANGEIFCWGRNEYGQLGGPSDPADECGQFGCSRTPVKTETNLLFRAVTAGFYHTCALDLEGAAYCWGSNDYGQLGRGTVDGGSGTLVAVLGGHAFTTIEAGRFTTCATKLDGSAYCWGWNQSGQLGSGAFSISEGSPLRVLPAG